MNSDNTKIVQVIILGVVFILVVAGLGPIAIENISEAIRLAFFN